MGKNILVAHGGGPTAVINGSLQGVVEAARSAGFDGSIYAARFGAEGILAGDPDYIFAVLQGADAAAAQASLDGALLSNPAWSGLRAVREGRFITLDHRLYNLKPNARWGEAYEKLADILYPN